VERRPKRSDGLTINPIEDGFVIYQAARDRAHYLNHTAVLVLELCDGRRRVAEIAELVRKAYGLGRAPRRAVDSALTRMASEGLVETVPAGGRATPPDRRATGRRAGRRSAPGRNT
jgi:hypothetical protein